MRLVLVVIMLNHLLLELIVIHYLPQVIILLSKTYLSSVQFTLLHEATAAQFFQSLVPSMKPRLAFQIVFAQIDYQTSVRYLIASL